MTNNTAFMPITKNGYTLRYKVSGNPVEMGKILSTDVEPGDGELYRITGGDPKVHNPASSGSVWCYEVESEDDGWQREFYPSVFDLVWVED
jgi:hypothetical protein